MKKHLTLSLLWLISTVIQAQVVEEWVSRYNGTGNGEDFVTAITLDDSGNLYVTGYSWGNGTVQDYTTIKYNSLGDTVWVRHYNGPGNGSDRANSITLDDSGNVYVTGGSKGIFSNGDLTTIKYDLSGNEVWIVKYEAPWNGSAGGNNIEVDNLGNVYVAGSIFSGSGWNFITVKYNSSGIEQWVRFYAGPGNYHDNINSMKIDSFGNVYVTGRSFGTTNDFDILTIKYSTNGDSLWAEIYNGPENNIDEAFALDLDSDENVYVTGRSLAIGTGYDYVTIKYNSTGIAQWVHRYNGTANDVDEAYCIVADDSGNVYVTGESNNQGTSFDYVTIKYNSLGAPLWTQKYNGPDFAWDIANSIALDDSGNVYVTGESAGGSPTYTDYATVKYNSSGVEQWVKRYNGAANSSDYGKKVAVDGSGNIYVAGHSQGVGTQYDYATIKYSQIPTDVYDDNFEIPENYSLHQNYPNPFNPSTTFRYAVPSESKVSITVFNLLGQEVATLVNDIQPAGYYEVTFNAANLSSGVYLYRINAVSSNSSKEFTSTKKFILLK